MKFIDGKLYYIKFLDHFIGNESKDEELICEATGWVSFQDGKYIELTFWKTTSSIGDEGAEEKNNEHVKILKSTIIQKKILKIKDDK